MSDEESEGEVPVCGSFEPQVWRKGYCRNCFHPGNKHQSSSLIIEDDKRKFGKENIPKTTDKSGKDHQSSDKGKPLKPAGQESGKSSVDKLADQKNDKLDKGKLSLKDRFDKLQKDKAKHEEPLLSARKTGSDKLVDDKRSIPDKHDSSKAIPPAVLPKTKGKGLEAGDKFKSKSTSDIREEIKSPIGNKAFKPTAQKDSLDKSKSKFGSAENISVSDKKLDGISKQKSGSAEKLSVEKTEKKQKADKGVDKIESPSSDKTKLDYRSLLSSKSSKTEDKAKDKIPANDKENKLKPGKETRTLDKSDAGLPKLGIKENETSKKESSLKLNTNLKSPLSSEKSPLHDKEKPGFKAAFEKPDLKSSKLDEKKDLKTKYEKPELKSLQEKDKKDLKSKYEKPGLKTVEEKEQKDSKSKYEKPDLKKVEEKETKDYKAKFEKPDLKVVEEKEQKDYKSKFEKPGLKTVEEKEKKDYKSKYEKPELKTVEEKEKKDYKAKFDKPELKTVAEKEQKDYKAKFDKPDLKIVEEKEKKDYKSKFEKPDLKSAKTDEKKEENKGKSSVGDKLFNKKVSDDVKLQAKDGGKDKPGSIKDKWKPKTQAEEKDSVKTPVLIHVKDGDKGLSKKSTEDNAKQSKDKSPASKWMSSLEKDKIKDNKSEDNKTKLEKPQLKSTKHDEKGAKEERSKSGKTELKSVSGTDEKVDYKKTLMDSKKTKTVDNSENESLDTKVNLDRPSLKSTKTDDAVKKDFKAKFERPQLKSSKSDEAKSDQKSNLGKPELETSKDKRKDDKGISSKVQGNLKETDSNLKDREILDNELNQKAEIENSTDNASLRHAKTEETDSLKQISQVTAKSATSDTTDVKPISTDNHSQHFDNLSSDAEADFDEPDNACALINARSESPLHVDTQVFTSSRNRSAGVDSGESDLLTTTPQKGLSGSPFSGKLTESPSREQSEEKEKQKHDTVSEFVEKKSSKEEVQEERIKIKIDNDVKNLKQELLKMAEKCERLEEDNESLKHGLSSKESDHSELQKQKSEVEALILGLQEQLKSMEDRCVRLESDNTSLMSNLKQQEETSKNQPVTGETEEFQDNIQYSESMVEDLIDENDNLKQEIQDLKVEMEEMYDSFRDQEAEEFRELQKELEITAKNCRILQFKMRKAERRNEQLEDDRNLFEDKLRILQNQFENKDAVGHIKTLEKELKMAKDVSVRLHDELDLMDDKRTKVEEENRHLTELLEQADRKQFRLEIEVDKLRDQIIDLRHQLNAAKATDDPDNPPRKINCAEFLAIHRDII